MTNQKRNLELCPALVCTDCTTYKQAQAEIVRRGLTSKSDIRSLAVASAKQCPPGAVWTDTLKPANVQQVG